MDFVSISTAHKIKLICEAVGTGADLCTGSIHLTDCAIDNRGHVRNHRRKVPTLWLLSEHTIYYVFLHLF